ncbi:MAG: twin-arginine translocase TatA/TatE family subunit [Acidobacteria bacterium]|nr:MAG: twin-arginine translocase TatA/TatE family subunit [Acidobacteriota bacterium]
MGGIKLWHIVVLIIAFVVLFGWKNLPSAARSLGESMRVFKSEVDQMKDDSAARKDKDKGGPEDTAHEEYRRLDEGRGDDGAPRA